MTAASGAVVTGPVALWARRGREQRPRLHRAFGYAWVTLMLVTAISALFIRDPSLPNIAGYTPVHLLVPLTLVALFLAFRSLLGGDIAGHRKMMQRLYFAACIAAGVFTLLPNRYLGHLLWSQFPMLLPVLRATPGWVWVLLAGLVVLGLVQARDRQASLSRIAITPVAMLLFSAWGTTAAFARSPLFAEVVVLWVLGAAVVTALLAAGRSTARYDAASRRFAIDGSWLPLALFLGVFIVRYVTNVRLAMAPDLALDRGFALPVAALYGALSGTFLGRAVQLWRLALRPSVALAA
jgi:uncharacterized membrane protein